jgi:hypothetical protein
LSSQIKHFLHAIALAAALEPGNLAAQRNLQAVESLLRQRQPN